ncbi:Telomere repeat-binding protein 4 [Quillaja saponaria]|uniref:Telomere repeat-binding protein 4 n=1 Tax=Quillaja saponaria TaxID=32244 RepID=A0AAD7VE13_QUISA|nr:Telomere repeat-binding protein 4 [Quillaja saponaria]
MRIKLKREHNMDREEHLPKLANMKCQRVKAGGSFVPSGQDEVVEDEHLLSEPKSDHVAVDGVLCYHEEYLGKHYDIENLSCELQCGLKRDTGGLDSYTTLEGDDLKLDALDGLLDDVEEVDDFDAANGLSSACEDYLLDFEYAEKAQENDPSPRERSLLGNSSSESQSSGLSASSTGAGGLLESSRMPIPKSECKKDYLGKTVICELHGTSRNKCPCQPTIGDNIYGYSLDIQNPDEFDNDDNSLVGVASSDSAEACQISALREKRLRKRTQRYIEEFSGLKSKENIPIATSKNKCGRSDNKFHHLRHRALRKGQGEKSISETSEVTLSQLRLRWRLPKKEVSFSPVGLESDEEPFVSDSEDDSMAKRRSRKHDRRKHQRMWTLSEVIKLVDGISEYGVGRWTEIKRVLFSSSAYRTPIDLRDKWRNLLRASYAKVNKKVLYLRLVADIHLSS